MWSRTAILAVAGVATFAVAALLAVGLAWSLSRLRPPGLSPANTAASEELVKRFIRGIADEKDADQIRFIAWGPHMSKAEYAAIVEEAGLAEFARLAGQNPDRFAQEMNAFDAAIRVRYERPRSQVDAPVDAPGDAPVEEDGVFFVYSGKVVLPMGKTPGGDDWKVEFRKRFARNFPGVKP